MKELPRFIAFCCACTLLSFCSSRDEIKEHHFQTYLHDGITIAETTGGPRYEGELFEYVPIMDLELSESEETMLFDPSSIICDSDGWIYIKDNGNGDVVVFDPEGQFHTRFGRYGMGPGEFQYAEFLCTVDDMVYIFDRPSLRTSRFNREGTLIDMVTTQQPLNALFPLAGGDQLHLSYHDASRGSVRADGNGGSWCDAVRLSSSGDTIWAWASDPLNNLFTHSVSLGGNALLARSRYPYSLRPETFYVPDLGIVAMAYHEPQLDILDLDGQVQLRIRIEVGDLSVTEEDRRAVLEAYDEVINDPEQDPGRVATFIEYRKGMQFGETKALWDRLIYSDEGYLFLRPRVSEQGVAIADEYAGFIVLSPEGEYLGRTKPPEGNNASIGGGKLVINNEDAETGEFTITVYEIRSSIAGLDYPN
ncbi:6-bladed beta-propeller [Gemmatimonadota bacterium]